MSTYNIIHVQHFIKSYLLGMLGVTIRFDSYHDAEEHLCRITEVIHNNILCLPQNDKILILIIIF